MYALLNDDGRILGLGETLASVQPVGGTWNFVKSDFDYCVVFDRGGSDGKLFIVGWWHSVPAGLKIGGELNIWVGWNEGEPYMFLCKDTVMGGDDEVDVDYEAEMACEIVSQKREVEVVPEVRVKMALALGEVEFREDGHLWAYSEVFGMKCYRQLALDDLRMKAGSRLTGEVKEGWTGEVPGEWVVPVGVLAGWGNKMLKIADGEMYGVYGRNKAGRWCMVIPEQKVSGASVDCDDIGKAMERLVGQGYRRVGTLHTHPGGMTTPSNTDVTDLFAGIGGLQVILARNGQFGRYISSGKSYCRLSVDGEKEDIGGVVEVDAGFEDDEGGQDWKKKVVKKVYTCSTGIGFRNWEDDWDERFGGVAGAGQEAAEKKKTGGKRRVITGNVEQDDKSLPDCVERLFRLSGNDEEVIGVAEDVEDIVYEIRNRLRAMKDNKTVKAVYKLLDRICYCNY
jgi:proteasome lid subunit RPN8/RPN11